MTNEVYFYITTAGAEMFSFITDPAPTSGGRIIYPQMDYIRKRVQDNARRLRNHYLSAGYAVASNHPLVTILGGIAVPMSMDPMRYRDKVSDIASMIGKHHGITSPIQNSPVQRNSWIYGGNIREAHVLLERDFTESDLKYNWKNLQPIRALRHTKTDLDLTVYTGKSLTQESGFAVIEIDIPMLACQYRQFRLEENLKPILEQQSVMQFVHKYPLVNFVPTHTDIAFINRIISTLRNEDYVKSVSKHSVAVATAETFTDAVIAKIVQTLTREPLRFTDILKSIPLPFGGNAFEFFKFPSYPDTRQIRWAIFLALIPLLSLLTQCSYVTRNGSNKTWINEILLALKRIHNDRTLETGLFGADLISAKKEIEEHILPYI